MTDWEHLGLKLGEELDLINKDEFKYLWVVDFPMFEWSEEEKQIQGTTSSVYDNKKRGQKIFDTNELEKIKTDSYDLVLNGYEIGGGSDKNTMKRDL